MMTTFNELKAKGISDEELMKYQTDEKK